MSVPRGNDVLVIFRRAKLLRKAKSTRIPRHSKTKVNNENSCHNIIWLVPDTNLHNTKQNLNTFATELVLYKTPRESIFSLRFFLSVFIEARRVLILNAIESLIKQCDWSQRKAENTLKIYEQADIITIAQDGNERRQQMK